MFSETLKLSKQRLWHFFFTKTLRERILLCTAFVLCITYGLVDFIYRPLLAQYHSLTTLHAHTLNELNLSLDSLQNNAQLAHQKQQTFQDAQNLNSRLKTHFSFYPPLEPLSLIPSLIELAKTYQLTLLSLEPNVSTSSLNIKGYGEFQDFKKLLFALESHTFLSLDFLSLSPRTHGSINFTLTLVHHIPDLRS